MDILTIFSLFWLSFFLCIFRSHISHISLTSLSHLSQQHIINTTSSINIVSPQYPNRSLPTDQHTSLSPSLSFSFSFSFFNVIRQERAAEVVQDRGRCGGSSRHTRGLRTRPQRGLSHCQEGWVRYHRSVTQEVHRWFTIITREREREIEWKGREEREERGECGNNEEDDEDWNSLDPLLLSLSLFHSFTHSLSPPSSGDEFATIRRKMTKSSDLDYSTIRRRKKSLAVGKDEESDHVGGNLTPHGMGAGTAGTHVGGSKSMFDIPAEMSGLFDHPALNHVWASGAMHFGSWRVERERKNMWERKKVRSMHGHLFSHLFSFPFFFQIPSMCGQRDLPLPLPLPLPPAVRIVVL